MTSSALDVEQLQSRMAEITGNTLEMERISGMASQMGRSAYLTRAGEVAYADRDEANAVGSSSGRSGGSSGSGSGKASGHELDTMGLPADGFAWIPASSSSGSPAMSGGEGRGRSGHTNTSQHQP